MPADATFAQRLQSLRKDAGLTQAELAGRAGVSAQFLWRLESGRQQPSLETARQLALALGVRLEKLSG